jgi:CheY-like chemotaxis protein
MIHLFRDGINSASTAGVPPAPRRARILVVEDDRDLRVLFASALMMAGYTVVVAEDGIDALRRIEEDRPHGIVLDLDLPRLGGRDVQQEIASRADTRDIPIIVVTGSDEELDPEDFRCVLRKPVQPDEVVEAVIKCVPPPPDSFSFFH